MGARPSAAAFSRSDAPGVDVDYLFGQVDLNRAFVDTNPSCGNILSAVGHAALEMGLVAASDPETRITIRNTNTGSLMEAVLQTPAGVWSYLGDARIDGVAERLPAAEVAADFATRPRAGQVMISVSAQSRPLASVEGLREDATQAEATLPDPVPCPADWIGFRLIPSRIEHWQGSRDRVHRRTVWWQEADAWREALLHP